MIKRSHASEEPSIRARRRLPARSFTPAVAAFLRSADQVARVGYYGDSLQRQSSTQTLRQLTTTYADGGALAAFMTQNAVGSGPATLMPGFAALPRSNAGQFNAVGTGLGQAAFILVSTDQTMAAGREPRRRIPRWI
jgi:hypothetical protein